MQIRPATIADADRIARIHVVTWQAAYRGLMPDTILDNLKVEWRAGFWRGRLAGQPRGVFVAESNQKMVGFCDLIPSRDRDADPQTIAEIAAIYILSEYWRQGTGRALCLRALQAARNERFIAVTLWALKSNIAAQRFYEAMGFHLDGATKSEPIQNHELDHVRFRISL